MSQIIVHQPGRQSASRQPDPETYDHSKEEIGAEQIQTQTDRVLESKHFRQAKSLDKFLRYAVAKGLAGEENDLKEYTIGVEVFQRGADYDPRKDAVVRVQANVLRKRLASYYEEEGALDEIVIEMPKGHYSLQFHRRALKTDLILPEAPITALVEVNEAVPALSDGNRPRWKIAGLVAATFALGLATAVVWQNWFGRSEASGTGSKAVANKGASDPAFLPLWEKFLEPGVENILAYGTPQFFVGNGLFLRDVQVNSPAEAESAEQLLAIKKTFHRSLTPTEVYTGVGETHGVHLLTRFFDKASSDLRVTRSRMVGWGELRNSNIIFLSSMRFQTLAKDLPYQSDFAVSPGTAGRITNLRPQAGESETYGGDGKGDYAVITVWPGKLQQRRILILSGITTWATLAAAEYVTDPEYLRQLNHHLEQCRVTSGRAQHPPFFQVLLRTEVKDNQPINISYSTHHDLEIPDSTTPGSVNVARLAKTQK